MARQAHYKGSREARTRRRAELPQTKVKVPAGAVDSHMHIVGDYARYPLAPTANVKPPVADVPAYLAVLKRIGVERCLVVQPSIYAFDNSCTMDAVATIGERARGVVVVPPTVTEPEIAALDARRACGVRFHMLPGGVLPWDAMEDMAAKVGPFGWHVQLQMDGRLLPERMPLLRRLKAKLVIDHTGKFLEPVATDHPAFRALLELVEAGNTWVKLSAPYETSKVGPPLYDDVGRLAKVLAKAAPERMLWATNWPHFRQYDPPSEEMLLDMMLDWIGDDSAITRALRDNPAEAFGF